MKGVRVAMLVVSLRGINFGFWSHLGCSGQNAIIFSREGLVQRRTRKIQIFICCLCFNMVSCRGQKNLGLSPDRSLIAERHCFIAYFFLISVFISPLSLPHSSSSLLEFQLQTLNIAFIIQLNLHVRLSLSKPGIKVTISTPLSDSSIQNTKRFVLEKPHSQSLSQIRMTTFRK